MDKSPKQQTNIFTADNLVTRYRNYSEVTCLPDAEVLVKSDEGLN